MSTTVTYKGSTLTTVNNNTKTLKTAGKYMEGDVVLTDVSGGTAAISVVDTTDSHGGTIREITALDISDTTAVASDVASGKYFYTSAGVKTAGTATGGGTGGNVWQDQNGYVHLDDEGGSGGGSNTSWERPSDWPDLSKMDVSAGDIIYMTSYADEARGFCNISVTCTGSYTVEVGTISGSTFTAESTYTISSGSRCRLYYGSANGTFKVLRVTGTTITNFKLGGESPAITIDEFYGYARNNGIIDVVGKLPSCTGMAHSYCYNLVNMKIDSVVLSGSVSAMFTYCTSLISLDASTWDTSAVTNTDSMFSYCYSLVSLDASKWDTSAVVGMSNMFYNCTSLASLDVSEWDTSTVENMNNMFSYCVSLVSLDVSEWDTSAVINMNSIFYNCSSLTSLDVSKWDTSAVTNMGNMFYNCYSLVSLDISEWDTSTVTNISDMFYNCYSLASLDVSKWDTSAVTSMASMFQNCYVLTSLDVSGWDFSKVTTASDAGSVFRYCRGLHGSITIPSSVTQIGTYFFGDTRSLYEYHFLSTTPPALANTNAFNNMTDFGGKKIYVPSASLTAYQTATNWSTYASYMVGE